GYEAELDRVDAYRKNNRNGRGRCLRSDCRGERSRGDHVHSTTDQVRCQCWQPFVLAFRPTKFDCDVPTFDISNVAQALPIGADKVCVQIGGRAAEKPHHWHGRLLRAGRERPHCAAAEKRDELTALHSITSSASNCIELETVRPRALGGLEVD